MLLVWFASGKHSEVANMSTERHLLSSLLKHYNKDARPVWNPHHAVNVTIHLTINIILAMVSTALSSNQIWFCQVVPLSKTSDPKS